MNIIVIKDKLREGVDAVSRISGDHPTLSILKNILIEVVGEKIRLAATNLEMGIQYLVPGKVETEGNITVPANLLSQVVSNIEEDRLALKVVDNALEVVTDSYNAKIQGTSSEEFPIIPTVEKNDEYVELEAETLRFALERALLATQFSELRPELNAVSLRYTMDALIFAATDSFRLGEVTLNEREFSATASSEFHILLPLRTAQEAARIFRDGGKVKIVTEKGQVLFRSENVDFISRLSEGTFPDYHAIIPKDFESVITADREEFSQGLKLASVFGSGGVELVLRSAGKKGVEIFSRNEKLGENTYVLPAKVSKEFKEVSFNSRYLQDGLKAAGGKEISLSLGEDNKPALLRAQGDPSYFYILMPILKA
jgi:DNA polymerase-3 subunit beta